ncbi:uncharacterized protein ALTATR162_LOCUS4479 [Alternaria atra]|uniref:PNPLA domain-containing protein n=1 Tax=Alternaria atra TaxID=119953 RepID=A0A8J2MZ62_9PLEO|nr:uncharacterized protein ALTATR162_LOCUS4479 [Alternaria atra]CAG5156682.1 unnamed protein product [Alternaria atra]
MLGLLGMTVQQCLEAYKRMAEQAFTPKRKWLCRKLNMPASPRGKFSGKSLADAVKKIVKEHTGDEEAVFADKTCVKTVVLAVTKADVGALPTKFKTYHIGDDFKHCKIWEIARATSAATTFFESIFLGHQNIEFIDAGFGHNNPSEIFQAKQWTYSQEFQQYMANFARDILEDRFKVEGSAKFIRGEFLLQDESEHDLDLRSPWKSIMKPGQRRHLSVKFRAIKTTACPHCGTDNELFEGQGTICQNCPVTYQRIVELGSEDETAQSTAVSKHKIYGSRKNEVTEDVLKLCFHRITLMDYLSGHIAKLQLSSFGKTATPSVHWSKDIGRPPVYRWQCCGCGSDNSYKTDQGCPSCWNHWRGHCCYVYNDSLRH